MALHLQREIHRLKAVILSHSELIETMVADAVESIDHESNTLMKSVKERDDAIDEAEVAIEEDCLKILALHQPVAIDLRYIVAFLKINNDLERVGDLAVNIAQCGRRARKVDSGSVKIDFSTMMSKVQYMLHSSMHSFLTLDSVVAREVLVMDDEVDLLDKEMASMMRLLMREQPSNLGALLQFLAVSRHLERIADHATNIAEDVIYMTEGIVVRHHPERLGIL